MFVLMLVSCATGTDVTKKNDDGSPIWTTEIPVSNRLLYGVGSAKFSTESNSREASYVNAVSDLGRKITVRINDATAAYSSESEKNLAEAFENIRVLTVSVTVKGVKTVDRWKAEDGTVWTLVSYEIKNLPKLYSDAANSYTAQQEEKKINVMNRLATLLEELGDRDDAEAVEMRSLAEKRASELVFEIESVSSGLHTEEITETLRENLIKDGYTGEEVPEEVN